MTKWAPGLLIVSLSFLCRAAVSQEAEQPTVYAEVQYMRVPAGGDDLYLSVEKTWKKVHAIRREAGIVDQWAVCKVQRTAGPPADYHYVVIHVFDSWDKLKNLYPSAIFQDKLAFSDEEQEIVNKTAESRTMVRSELWQLDDVAIPSRLGQSDFDKTMVLGFMKSKNAGRHRELEEEVWKKVWAQAAVDGYRSNWLLWSCRYPGGQERPFNAIALHLFPKGEPDKMMAQDWWKQAWPKMFPGKSQEEVTKLMEETGQVRDIPITEKWTIVMALDNE